MASVSEDNKIQTHQLCIDYVVSSQPELGPKIPDGGYGWVILLASSFFQILIPSLPIGFGTIILFARIENGISNSPTLWDINAVYVPIFFISIWTVTEPLCRKLVSDSTWPRLVSIAATCLMSAGLLIMWIAMNNRKTKILYIIAGSVSGFGASLILTQINVIISQYFYLKLQTVKAILTMCSALGFVITPICLGHYIFRIGILYSINWYQAIILQGIIISLVFKKPKYLKQHRSRYNLLRGIADEEEDIFTKNTTELQSPRKSSQYGTTITDVDSNSISQPQSLHEELKQAGWEKFKDETHVSSNKHTRLNVAFAVEFNNAKKNNNNDFEENYTEMPQPLFMESYLNNNISYSYESSPAEIDNPVVFMPLPNSTTEKKWSIDLQCFKEATFYKTLLLVITLKYSIFVFWTLFPSYLYLKVDHLKVHHTTVIMGCLGIAGVILSTMGTCIKLNTNIRIIFVSVICWASAVGCLMLSSSNTQTWIVFAAIIIILNITSLQTLATPLMKYNFPAEQSNGHLFLSIITAVCLIALLGIDISYQNCFRLLAILQFLAGSLCFLNILYKAIRKYINYH